MREDTCATRLTPHVARRMGEEPDVSTHLKIEFEHSKLRMTMAPFARISTTTATMENQKET
jgi:hypothetical protein